MACKGLARLGNIRDKIQLNMLILRRLYDHFFDAKFKYKQK